MFETLLIQPIYNVFVYLIGIMPGGDVGFAIILLTLLMRILFYPAFTASIRTQMGMQAIQGDVDEINTKYKDDPKSVLRAQWRSLKSATFARSVDFWRFWCRSLFLLRFTLLF